MTAEHIRDPDRPQHSEQVTATPQVGEGVLIRMHERAQERRRTLKQREMFEGFLMYTEDNFGIDLRTADPAQSEAIAKSAHGFISRTVQRRIETLGKLAEEKGEPMPKVHIIPPEQVKRHLTWYYKEFGYNRRQKSKEVAAKEEAWLRQNKLPIYATVRTGGELDEEGNDTPTQEVPRASYFQELALGIDLEHALRVQGHEIAADGVETLLAAYGAWFPQRLTEALQKRRAIMRSHERDNHNIWKLLADDMPEEFRAEKPRKRK